MPFKSIESFYYYLESLLKLTLIMFLFSLILMFGWNCDSHRQELFLWMYRSLGVLWSSSWRGTEAELRSEAEDGLELEGPLGSADPMWWPRRAVILPRTHLSSDQEKQQAESLLKLFVAWDFNIHRFGITTSINFTPHFSVMKLGYNKYLFKI